MDKRTVIAFLLIGAILILTQSNWYKESVLGIKPQPVKKVPSFVARDSLADVPAPSESLQAQTDPIADDVSVKQMTNDNDKIDLVNAIANLNAGTEHDVIIDSDLYHGVISTRGATIKSWQLKKYFFDKEKGEMVELIKKRGYGNLGLIFPFEDDTLQTYDYNFSVDKTEVILNTEVDNVTLTFELKLSEDQLLRKTFRFYNDKYAFDLDVELIELADNFKDNKFSVVWLSGMNHSEKDIREDMRNTKAYISYGGDLDELKMKEKPNQNVAMPLIDGKIDWVALRTKYFATIIFPKTEDDLTVKLTGKTEVSALTKSEIFKTYSAWLTFKVPESKKNDFTQNFEVYLGPLDYSIVKQYHAGFDKIMGYGPVIIRPFAKLTISIFTFLHKYIPNYGFVLLIFSVLVKLIVYPLTRKSYVSMKEMQKLQPLTEELKAKYGNDPQRLNKETMKLYKEHGVNPLSGCLPNLLQMPLLWAIFLVFRNTIELRQEPFIGWITDLSAPDTIHLPVTLPLFGDGIHILPLIMGATIFIQQKMTVTDPKQKTMMYFMPFFLTFIFYRFPSGLNLYYALFNILSMIQQRMIHTSHENAEAA